MPVDTTTRDTTSRLTQLSLYSFLSLSLPLCSPCNTQLGVKSFLLIPEATNIIVANLDNPDLTVQQETMEILELICSTDHVGHRYTQNTQPTPITMTTPSCPCTYYHDHAHTTTTMPMSSSPYPYHRDHAICDSSNLRSFCSHVLDAFDHWGKVHNKYKFLVLLNTMLETRPAELKVCRPSISFVTSF